MRRALPGLLVVVGSVVGGSTGDHVHSWVQGFERVTTALPGLGVGSDDLPAGCGVGAGITQTLRADLADLAGPARITASLADGITVRDRQGAVLFQHRGVACGGSADELDSLRVGWIDNEPTIILLATTGGRRETTTTAYLYRLGHDHRLDAVFAAPIETREENHVSGGGLVVRPHGLTYSPPAGGAFEYRFDEIGRTYVTLRIPEH